MSSGSSTASANDGMGVPIRPVASRVAISLVLAPPRNAPDRGLVRGRVPRGGRADLVQASGEVARLGIELARRRAIPLALDAVADGAFLLVDRLPPGGIAGLLGLRHRWAQAPVRRRLSLSAAPPGAR